MESDSGEKGKRRKTKVIDGNDNPLPAKKNFKK
jgi:hypothetical protein